MWIIFKRAIKDRKNLIIVYTIVNIILLWMYIALFPSFKTQSASLEELIKSYPESFLKAFNFDIKSFTTIEGFLATEQFSFMWPLLMILMLVGYSGFALSGEIEKGTIEVLLSHSISRVKLFFGRYITGAFMLVTFVVLSFISALILCRAYNISVQTESFLTMSLLGLMFGLAIYSIGMFFSALFSEKGKVFFASGSILVLMYVLNIVSALKDSLVDLKYFSFFYYYNPSKALINNQIDDWSYLVFLGVALILTILGAIAFQRKEIST